MSEPQDFGGLPKTAGQPQKTGVIFKVEGGQVVIYNGAGDKTWIADTTSGAVAIPLPAPGADGALGVVFTVKRTTGGANALTITPESGNIDGSATYSLPTQYQAVRMVSDGTNYWTLPPAAADLSQFVTSNSLSAAIALFVTSNSLSAAIAGINTSTLLSSNSASAALATDALTIRNSGTIAGHPLGGVLLGAAALAGVNSIAFSGSWSDIGVLELFVSTKAGGNGQGQVVISTDGGTTAFLSVATATATLSAVQAFFGAKVFGGDNRAIKFLQIEAKSNNLTSFNEVQSTATASLGFVNYLRFQSGASLTLSSGLAYLFGWRNA